MNRDQFNTLLDHYITGQLTEDEHQQLQSMLNDSQYEELLGQHIREVYDQELPEWNREFVSYQKVRSYLTEQIKVQELNNSSTVVFSISGSRQWWRIAAVLMLLVMGAVWLYFSQHSKPVPPEISIVSADVQAPASSKAILTLEDGRQIKLDSTQGLLAMQAGIMIHKYGDGLISYEVQTTGSSMAYNTIVNPRGSNIVKLQLSDGSSIWLNAESSIRYPTVFKGNERKVVITGEVYFDIKKETTQPFIVQCGHTSVQVLGTKFNINGYTDETNAEIALLEGAVKVSNRNNHQLLSPGQLVQVSNTGDMHLRKGADIEQSIAWKNGQFRFKNTTLEQIMRQLTRWYDVEVVYSGAKNSKLFEGEIPRDVPVSEVLKILEFAGARFKIENKTITVMQ